MYVYIYIYIQLLYDITVYYYARRRPEVDQAADGGREEGDGRQGRCLPSMILLSLLLLLLLSLLLLLFLILLLLLLLLFLLLLCNFNIDCACGLKSGVNRGQRERRVVLGDVQHKGVVRCSLDSSLESGQSPPLNYPP